MFDNPDLLACCVVGDGEAETGALATSWHSNKFLNPARDGAVLPILHLNGYKIANPTVLGRLSDEELTHLFNGYGYKPHFVEGHEPEPMHQMMAATLDTVIGEIREIQEDARSNGSKARARLADDRDAHARKAGPDRRLWMANRSKVHGAPTRCRSRTSATKPGHLKILEDWMKSYLPEELFDETGKLRSRTSRARARRRPAGWAQIRTPTAALLLKDLLMPDFRDYAVKVAKPGTELAEATRVLGTFLRDVMKLNLEAKNFRVFGPDETASNRLDALYEVTGQSVRWNRILPTDEHESHRPAGSWKC